MKKKKKKPCKECGGSGIVKYFNWILPNDVIEEQCQKCKGTGHETTKKG